MIRAIFRACEIPGGSSPYDRASLKIFYPASPDDGEEQRNAGVVPADRSGAPYPVLVMMPGINVGPESYAWLARALVSRGIITVTYSMIAEEMPGYVSLTPGLDLGAITPETWGTRPSSTAIAPIVETIKQENAEGVLAGCIDTGNIVLGGHSAGGSVAIYNARSDWFPEIKGAFAYAAHAVASTVLGFADNTVLDLGNDVPVMLVGGTRDGVMASSSHRYGASEGESPDRIAQTFDEGVRPNSGTNYLFSVEGANHFSLAYPVDDSTGRHFLDEDEQGDGEQIRLLLTDLVESFVMDACDGGSRTAGHDSHQLISTCRSK